MSKNNYTRVIRDHENCIRYVKNSTVKIINTKLKTVKAVTIAHVILNNPRRLLYPITVLKNSECITEFEFIRRGII